MVDPVDAGDDLSALRVAGLAFPWPVTSGALRAGHETGWWDDNGIPAPWPEDFLDPNSGWQPASYPNSAEPPQNGDEPPF